MSENPPLPDYDIALCLDEPYAAWISQGVQTIHVEVDRLPPDVLATSTVLVGDKAYGRITLLPEPQELDQKAFDSLRGAHRIDVAKQTEYARERPAWRDGPFYAYTFKYEPFPAPIPYEILPDEPLEKACSRRRKIKKLTIIKAMCPECHKDPCECKKPEVCPDCGKEPCECEEVEKSMVPEDDILLKPKGPWGDGFKECEAYVRSHYPKIKDPTKYCAGIYQSQKKSLEKTVPSFIERPTAYDVILHDPDSSWTLSEKVEKETTTTYMSHTDGELITTLIYKISFPKDTCPCAIMKIDFTPYSEWYTLKYNPFEVSIIKGIDKKK